MTDNQIDVEPVGQAHVRRAWCVRLAVGLVLLGALLNIIYLWWHCPLDLGEDESHYWEWSRHLDWGYYSKGPGVAWIIAAATAVGRWFGFAQATMPVVRMPAVLFGAFSGLVSLSLARRIFRDDRAALAVTVLCACQPVFAAGSLMITIDSPMYCCWALAVWAIWRAVEGPTNFEPMVLGPESRSPAPGGSPGCVDLKNCGAPKGRHFLYLAGLFTGLGMLAKPVLIAIPLCALVAAWMSPAIRRRLVTWHSAGAVLLALALQAPVIMWNSQHGWMMFRHIGTQGALVGTGQSSSQIPMLLRPLVRLGMYVGIQVGVLAVIVFVLLIIAVIWALRERRHASPANCAGEAWHQTDGLTFLLAFTLPLWFFYAALSLWTNVEPNWPVASYFTGMILLGGFVARHWGGRDAHARLLRQAATAAVLCGIVAIPIAQHTEWFYPILARMGHGDFEKYKNWLRKDPAFRAHGLEARALALDAVLKQMEQQNGRKPMVITDRYDYSSSLAFYLPGQPFVYSIMSSVGGRMNQYDVWPGVNERDGSGALVHRGENAVVAGASLDDKTVNAVIVPAFKRVDPVEHVPVYDEHGLQIRQLTIWRCYDFQGLPEVKGTRSY